MAHSVLYLFYRYHYPFEVFHLAFVSSWSFLLGCPLAALHLLVIYSGLFFGHGYTHRTHSPLLILDALHLGHRSVATFIPRALAIQFLSVSSHLSMCHYHDSIPHHHAFATSHWHFLIISVPIRAGLYKSRHKAQAIHYNDKILSSSLAPPAAYCVYELHTILSADRAYLSTGLASSRGVLVFPPLSVFLDLGTRLVIFSFFLLHLRFFPFPIIFSWFYYRILFPAPACVVSPIPRVLGLSIFSSHFHPSPVSQLPFFLLRQRLIFPSQHKGVSIS